jgi:hypothetical protein
MTLGLTALPVWAGPVEGVIPDDKAVVQFDTKMGVVTFNHLLHATLRTNSCETCHHTHQPGEPFMACATCHKGRPGHTTGGAEVPKISTVIHLRCRGCHEYTLKELHKPAGPTKCKLCHVKLSDTLEP